MRKFALQALRSRCSLLLSASLLIVSPLHSNAAASEFDDYVVRIDKHVINSSDACGKSQSCGACFEIAIRAEMIADKYFEILELNRKLEEKREDMSEQACRHMFEGLQKVESWGERASRTCSTAKVVAYLKRRAEATNQRAAILRKALAKETLDKCVAEARAYEARIGGK
jgi:hypothetical protein